MIYSTDPQDLLIHNEPLDLEFFVDRLGYATTGFDDLYIWIVNVGSVLDFGCRIKVSYYHFLDNDNHPHCTITVEDQPRIIGELQLTDKQCQDLVKWVQINKDVLIDYFNQEFCTFECMDKLELNKRQE